MKQLKINLSPKQTGDALYCTATFINTGNESVFLNKTDICYERKLTSKLFVVKLNDREIPYTGIMAKRGIALANDFLVLHPNEQVSTVIRLDQKYGFLSGRHTYTIQYSMYHSSPEENPQLNKFESPLFSFEYTK